MKVTQWFDGKEKPVRVGIYERDYGEHFYQNRDYWDGRHWRYENKSGLLAAWQGRRWRGLAEKP